MSVAALGQEAGAALSIAAMRASKAADTVVFDPTRAETMAELAARYAKRALPALKASEHDLRIAHMGTMPDVMYFPAPGFGGPAADARRGAAIAHAFRLGDQIRGVRAVRRDTLLAMRMLRSPQRDEVKLLNASDLLSIASRVSVT